MALDWLHRLRSRRAVVAQRTTLREATRRDNPLTSTLHQPDTWCAVGPSDVAEPLTEAVVEDRFQYQLQRVASQTDEFTADALSAWLDAVHDQWLAQIDQQTDSRLRTERRIVSQAHAANVEAQEQLNRTLARIREYEPRIDRCTRILAGEDEDWTTSPVPPKDGGPAEKPYKIPEVERPDLNHNASSINDGADRENAVDKVQLRTNDDLDHHDFSRKDSTKSVK